MIKVITYGSFDLLHQGHINILRRAKALGDYLYVGVTTDNFDVSRGKVNVVQSLQERMDAVKATGYADEVFPEEYEGQKIDDIRRFGIDIFVVGSDWVGKFDYLREYCQVVYLPRTEGISSSQLRGEHNIKIGVVGEDPTILKLKRYAEQVNGISIDCICGKDKKLNKNFTKVYSDYDEMLNNVDGVYVAAKPTERASFITKALDANRHILSESPICLGNAAYLFEKAKQKNLVLFDCVKTAYSLPFSRMLLLIKSGVIGNVKAIEATCTSLENYEWLKKSKYYTSLTGWGATAVLPVLGILGTNYKSVNFSTIDGEEMKDIFTKINFDYGEALATVNVGVGIKSEGDLRISGEKGYIYVPAPWWLSPYFEVKYEDPRLNKRYYYNNDGEGITSELVHFVQCVKHGKSNFYLSQEISENICKMCGKNEVKKLNAF